jgi:hypothetical protein
MAMNWMGAGPLLGVLIAGAPGCALLAGGFPDGRSGTLTTADGAPIAGADVIVESWTTGMRGQHLARKHTYATTTDADGRWVVPARPSICVGILAADGLPTHEDEYTFRAAGQRDLHTRLPWPGVEADATDRSTMRADASGPPPFGAVTMLVAGGTLGAGQKVAAHLGGMVVASRGGFGAGARAAAETGVNGAGAAAGVVVVPIGATFPNLAFELSARVVRPWRAASAVESGPEIGFDLLGYRLTLAWLGPSVGAPVGARRVVVGFGFGYF